MKKKTGKDIIKYFKDGSVNLDETLFNTRIIFIDEVINDEMCGLITRQLMVLDMMNKQPIQIFLDSPGGSVAHGFSIIDIMRTIGSRIITIAKGQVASMATLIAIAGDERKCFKNTTFMLHDMFSGVVDYSKKMKDRAEFIEAYYDKLKTHIAECTTLTGEEIDDSRNGELWLFADEAKKKGLIDKII